MWTKVYRVFGILMLMISVSIANIEILSDLRFINQSTNEVNIGSTLRMELAFTFQMPNSLLAPVQIELLSPQSGEDNVMAMVQAEVTFVSRTLDILPHSPQFKMMDKEKGEGISVYYRRSILDIDEIYILPNKTEDETKLKVSFETMLVPPSRVNVNDNETKYILTTLYYGKETNGQNGNTTNQTTIQNSLPYRIGASVPQGIAKTPNITIYNPFHGNCPMGVLVNIQVKLYAILHNAQVSIDLISDQSNLKVTTLYLTDAGINYRFTLEFIPSSLTRVPCINQTKNFTTTQRVNLGTLYNREVTNDRATSDADVLQFIGTIVLDKQTTADDTYHARLVVKVNKNTTFDENISFKAKASQPPFHVICDTRHGMSSAELQLNDVTGIQITLNPVIKTKHNYTIISRVQTIPTENTNGMTLHPVDDACLVTESLMNITYNCTKIPDNPIMIWAVVDPDVAKAGNLYRIEVDISFDDIGYKSSYFMEYRILNNSVILDPNDKDKIHILVRPRNGATGLIAGIYFHFTPVVLLPDIPVAFGSFIAEVPLVTGDKLPQFRICNYGLSLSSTIALGNVSLRSEMLRFENVTYNRTFFILDRLAYFGNSKLQTKLTLRIHFEFIDDVSGWNDKKTWLPVRVRNMLNETLEIGTNLMKNFRVHFPHRTILTSINIPEGPNPYTQATFHYSSDGYNYRNFSFQTTITEYLKPPILVEYYRVSWPRCNLMSKQEITTLEVSDVIKIANDDGMYYTNGFIAVFFSKICMTLPVLNDTPPALLVSLKPVLLGVSPGPFKLNLTGNHLYCSGESGKTIKVSYTTFDSASFCGNEIEFCRLHDFTMNPDDTNTCSFICNCAPAVTCSPLNIFIMNSRTIRWSLCEVTATNH